ncbi:MAG: ABC transporter substrate-binding protein [Sulfobacillus benefaciens]|uniref:ABC transporter substrate-binding protein n=1 Tax=Sulfobacillus benefaciens TaxID=453960 RepID=A0A2T2X9A1_9FIRM|nr:MAG: ABC transporter substrate-binding protein [Sulfobacillus benefaciens]
MIRISKVLSLSLACSTVALLAAGCGNSTTSNQASANHSKVTVTVWSWTPVSSTMNAIVAKIEQKYPNIHIQTNIEPNSDYLIALKSAAASGSLPDIIGLSAGSVTQEYRPDLQPLNTIAQKLWGPGWKQDFPSAALSQAMLGNPAGNTSTYMLPQEVEVINIWYNRQIFQQLHLTPPTSFAQLASDAHAIQKAGYIGFYEGAAQSDFVQWMYMQIAAQTDLRGLEASARGVPEWTQPGMIKAANYWKDFFTDGVFQAGALGDQQYPTGANLFAAGRVGMMSLGSWWLQESQMSTSPQGLKTMQDYGTFFLPPMAPGLKATPPMGGVDFGWGMTQNSAKSLAVQKATEEVFKQLISGVGEQTSLNQMNDLPAFKGMTPTISLNSHILSLYHNYLAEIQVAHNHEIGNPTVAQALVSNLQSVAAGTESAAAAMQAVQKIAVAQENS